LHSRWKLFSERLCAIGIGQERPSRHRHVVLNLGLPLGDLSSNGWVSEQTLARLRGISRA